ncbi:hypothetical protein L3X39_02910 [Sabulilitoribacter multivorans]|uniref:Peptidase MA superfamily protein n=1 Tax=Flaviramulus multivorans TaxID=1304750 RepID=A0ABS9IFN1_9FLAO|nr:hypothetical protein [Flaviramulus multivorans]MCF7559572.1 hypothetical protein [Flaviramulus multivorans]
MKILITILIITISNIINAQIANNTMPPYDFEIDKKIVELIKKLERGFDKKVSIKVSELQLNQRGNGQIKGDLLMIEIDKNVQDKNEVLLHELLHFEIKLLGVPNAVGWMIPDNESRENNMTYLSSIREKIWDKIHHYFFYPIMVSDYGYDPYLFAKNELINLLKTNEAPEINNESEKSILIACNMLHIYVETNDEIYLKNFEKFLHANYNIEGIIKGRKLIELFKSNDFTSLNTFSELFVNCFNLLHDNIKIKSWELVESDAYDKAKNLVIYFN